MTAPRSVSFAELGSELALIERSLDDRNVAGLLQRVESPVIRGEVSVAGEAAKALQTLGDPRVADIARRLLSHQAATTRVYALQLLRDVGSATDDGERITASLKDDDAYVRAVAARTLGLLGVASAAAALRETAERDSDRYARKMAKEALSVLDD